MQEAEKQARDHQIRTLQDELTGANESLNKTNKEKKQLEENNRKLQDDLNGTEDKLAHMTKLKSKLESSLDEVSDLPTRAVALCSMSNAYSKN